MSSISNVDTEPKGNSKDTEANPKRNPTVLSRANSIDDDDAIQPPRRKPKIRIFTTEELEAPVEEDDVGAPMVVKPVKKGRKVHKRKSRKGKKKALKGRKPAKKEANQEVHKK